MQIRNFGIALAAAMVCGIGAAVAQPPATNPPKPAPQPPTAPAPAQPPSAPAKAPETEKTVQVIMSTSMGDITLELNREKAPISVDNFLKYVDEKFYDGTVF